MKKAIKITLTLFITLIIVLGFALPLNPLGNWYQQFIPNLNGAFIRDITFTDSLNGHCVTSIGGSNSYILKTTNSGDNWTIKFMHTQPFVRVEFINTNTGFTNAFQTIFKTTNAGENWNAINLPGIFGDDMFVLNEDTIWLAMSESLTGGVFRTTNGGLNWVQQLNIGSQNPEKVYMFNARIGFISDNSGTPSIRRTTNGGLNWNLNVNGQWYSDIKFADSLTGWYSAASNIYKTSSGGDNWILQNVPSGPDLLNLGINKLSILNKDTLWAAGNAAFYPNSQVRGILLRTTDGGNNWQYQVPDTAINNFLYYHIQFTDKYHGWAYTTIKGIHTTTGGDPVWITGITQISNNVPKDFMLFQNYPNPFNPVTNIKYQTPLNPPKGGSSK